MISDEVDTIHLVITHNLFKVDCDQGGLMSTLGFSLKTLTQVIWRCKVSLHMKREASSAHTRALY